MYPRVRLTMNQHWIGNGMPIWLNPLYAFTISTYTKAKPRLRYFIRFHDLVYAKHVARWNDKTHRDWITPFLTKLYLYYRTVEPTWVSCKRSTSNNHSIIEMAWICCDRLSSWCLVPWIIFRGPSCWQTYAAKQLVNWCKIVFFVYIIYIHVYIYIYIYLYHKYHKNNVHWYMYYSLCISIRFLVASRIALKGSDHLNNTPKWKIWKLIGELYP